MTLTTSTRPAPHLAVSMHAWDPYYTEPGPREKPSPMLLKHLDALERIGGGALSRVRVDMGWSSSQPSPSEPSMSHYYNRRFMSLFVALQTRGLKPFVVVHQSPAWARRPGTDAKRYPMDPDSIRPWAAWAASTFAPWVTEWECWNEPNLEAFTGVGLNRPELYVQLLKAFTAGVRAGNPEAKVIGGNVSQSDFTWLDEAYEYGLGQWCDIVGVHPYQGRQSVPPSSTNVSGLDQSKRGWQKGRIALGLDSVGQVMAWHGDQDKPLWCTEQGWSSGPGEWGVAPLERTQQRRDATATKYIREFLDMLAEREAFANVRLSTLYQLFDPLTTDPHQQGFAVVTPAGFVKPQARILTRWRDEHPTLRALY